MPGLTPFHTRPSSTTRPFALALFLIAAASQTGCMSWKTENVAPVQALKSPVPARLKVTMVNGETRYLDSARVEGDSLIGNALETKGRWTRDRTGTQVHVPGQPAGRTAFLLSDIERTGAQRVNAAKSLAIGVPVVGILGLIVLAASFSGSEY